MSIVKFITIKDNGNMISYAPFWKTLKARGMSTYTLISKYNISSATIDRIRKGGGISTSKLDDLCAILNCRVENVIEYVGTTGKVSAQAKADANAAKK